MRYGAVHQGGHANEVREDFGIVSARVCVHLVNHKEGDKRSDCYDPDADGAADNVKAGMLHGSSLNQQISIS
jgi:hypothetical protein